MYPAKYTFDVTAFPSCTADFAVFPINSSTGSSRASVTGIFSAEPVSGDTFSITTTPTGATLTLVASNNSSTGLNFLISPSPSIDASRLAAAINRNLSASIPDRIVAVASGSTVTVYALTPGSGETLTDATTSSEFSWPPADAAPGGDAFQANIVAFNELYAGTGGKCGAQPAFIFSYASGVGPIATSPTLSLDGTKIAYVENDPNIGAILHVLTYASGSTEFGVCNTPNGGAFPPDCATNPVIPGSTPGSTATDAMLPLGLLTVNAATGAPGATDTFSSPFIHYGLDTLYVGDDNGYLYSIYPTFTATPAHAGGNFPVSLIAPAASETPSAVTAVHSTGIVTVTVPSTTGLGIGELVTIAGVAPHGTQCSAIDAAEINGTWTIASIPSGTKFTFVTTITTSTNPPGCTVTSATVTPGTSYVSAPSVDGNITGNLFVGDSSGNLYMVSGAGVQATLSVGTAANGGVRNGPIVDSTRSVGYAVTACSGGDSALTQFTFTTTTMTKVASAGLDSSGEGCTGVGFPTYDPTPDARYFNLGISNGTAAKNGEIIAAASTTTGQQISTFQFISSAIQTTPEATATVGSGPSVISPLTEFYNNTFITSSMSSITATQGNPGVVTVTAHNTLSVGDVVLISGVAADGNCDAADVAGINGMSTVTSASTTQFTFNATIPDTPSGPCDHFGSATGGPDYMFMGVAQNSPELFSFLLPSAVVSGAPPPVTNSTDVAGGTSGIIIDNNDAVDGQTASVYYGTLATSSVCSDNFCAIKLTQGGLQ